MLRGLLLVGRHKMFMNNYYTKSVVVILIEVIFVLNFKLFGLLLLKNKLIMTLLVLLFTVIHSVSILNFLWYLHTFEGAFLLLSQSLLLANFTFVVFLFLSFEYFYAVKKSNLLEVLQSTRFGTFKLYSSQFLVMLLLNVVSVLSFTLYNVVAYFYYGFEMSGFLMHILLNMFLNFFMMQVVAILIGLVLALVFDRIVAYMIAILFLFSGSWIFEEIVMSTLVATGGFLFPIHDFFSFSLPALRWETNFHIGFSILPYRFWLLIIWIIILTSIILIRLTKRQKVHIILIVTSFVVLVPSVYFYLQPVSRQVLNLSPAGSLRYDYYHYKGKEIQVKEANFNVLTYDLKVIVGNQLNVVATLTVDELLSEYYFTLYHRYVISNITDQAGETMEFSQQGDHFIVYNEVENLEAIIIYYTGYSPRFYSNKQGMVLPGFFPYFPHAGHQLVFDYQLEDFELVMLDQEAHFNVIITGVDNVFSNLEQICDNHFSGYATSVTLISGFLNSQVIDDITVVYPFLNHMEFNHNLNIRHVHYFINDFGDSDTIQTIIILPNLSLRHMTNVVHGDHITTRGLVDLATFLYESLINPNKYLLYWYIDLYLNDRESFYEIVYWDLSSDIFDYYQQALMMQERIEDMGLELFLELAFSYIEDDTDERSIGEFLIDLEKE